MPSPSIGAFTSKCKWKVVGVDPDSDIAVLKVDSSKLPAITIGDSSNLRVGDVVLAIGNPYGVGKTVTMGIISATGRSHLGISTFENYIQTDAAINPGNSGGPLIDSSGRLIGVNTAIISGSGSSAGIGFAVPVDVVNTVVPQLIAKGKFPRPGIGIVVLEDQAAASLGVVGVVIDRVMPGSAADRAGLEGIDYRRRILGDVIVAVGGRPVANMEDFVRIMQDSEIGQSIELQVRRGDAVREVAVTVMDIS